MTDCSQAGASITKSGYQNGNSPNTNRSSALPLNPSQMTKDEKRRAIKDLLKSKLGITNIYDVVIGQKLNFESEL
jgi:hypothetical protein